MYKLPNILHIGYSKSMSTWLQEQFSNCQDIFFVGKTGYFQFYFNNYSKGIEYYKHYFTNITSHIVLESDEHLILPDIDMGLKINVTNQRLTEQVIKRITTTLGSNIKILVVIRNQKNMLLSKYAQYVRGGGKFSPKRFANVLLDNYENYADFRYSYVINKLWDTFGIDNVFVLVLEEFKSKNSKKQISVDLNNFIGAECIDPNYKVHGSNVSPSIIGIYCMYIINKLFVKEKKDHIEQAKTRIPFKGWLVLKEAIEIIDGKFIKTKNTQKLFDKNISSKIQRIYSADNKYLSKLLKKDLKNLGYYHE